MNKHLRSSTRVRIRFPFVFNLHQWSTWCNNFNFANDTCLISKVLDANKSVVELNADLKKINQWAYQWKIQFNPDPNKQTNEVIFSWRSISHNLSHPPINPIQDGGVPLPPLPTSFSPITSTNKGFSFVFWLLTLFPH